MLHWKKLSSGRVALLWILMVGSVFNLASHSTKNRVRAELGSRLTGEEKIRDIDSMPAPGNPFCWHSWTVTEGQESFQFRSAAIAPFPMLVSPKACALSTRMAPVLAETVRTSAASQDPAVQWMYENTLSKKLLRETLKNSCTFKRLMTFLRFPFLKRINEDEWFAGDLRYDQRESNNFTAFRFKVGSKIENDCGPLNAPWEAPFFRTGSSLEEPEKSDRE